MPNRCKRAIRVTFLALAVALVSSVGAAAPAGAAVKDCAQTEVSNRALYGANVTSVRNMSCRRARRAIRRNGRHQKEAAYGGVGARFRLGPWSCSVYYHNYELWKARCVRGKRAFRVDYGF